MARSLESERTNLTEARAEIERLRLIIRKLQRSHFGRRAEQLDGGQLQLGLDDLNAVLARAESRIEAQASPPLKAQSERASLPSHLEREEVRFDLDHQTCSCCLHLIT